MSLEVARPFNIRFGKLTASSATVVAMSRTSESVTLTVDGNEYVITMAAVGEDRPTNDPSGSQTLGYRGERNDITFSAPLTVYPWTAVQGANQLSKTIRSGPVAGQDFAVAFPTCMTPFRKHSLGKREPSGWALLSWYRQNGPVPLGMINHSDDIGYPDGAMIGANESAAPDPNGKQLVFNQAGSLTRSRYNYAFYYGHWYGIIGPVTVAGTEYFNTGLDSNFLDCTDNTAVETQQGDHENVNNFNWALPNGGGDGPQSSVTPNPLHATPNGFDGNGWLVYSALCKPLQGTSAQGADTEANHWYTDLGDLRIINVDPITKASSSGGTPVTCLGNAQVDDILTRMDSAHVFKALNVGGMAGRFLQNLYIAGNNQYIDKSWQNYVPAEYDRLFRNTGQTPKSVMDNPRCNGILGSTIVLSGDWHNELSLYHKKPAEAGKAAESFHRLGLCNLTANNPSVSILPLTNDAWDNDGVELMGGICSTVTTSIPYRSVMTIVEVYGSEYPKRMRVKQYGLRQAAPENDPLGAGDMSAYFRNRLGEVNLGEITDHEGNIWRCFFERDIYQWFGNYGQATTDPKPLSPVTQESLKGDILK